MGTYLDAGTLARRFNPKKSLAQNFLTDESHLHAIAAAAELTERDTVLEIGPGLGVLTHHLAAQAGRVVAVELDEQLVGFLQERFADDAHVSIVHGDILQADLPSLVGDVERLDVEHLVVDRLGVDSSGNMDASHATKPAYKVVANLPYYITSAVLRYLLESECSPTTAILMVQKEVAERICAAPGNLSILAVSVQFYANPQIVRHVPAEAFYPRPKVDSAVLRLDVLPSPVVDTVDPNAYFRVVKAGFSKKRKQLLNSVSAGLHRDKSEIRTALESAQIDPKRRAETLTLMEWGDLCRILMECDAVGLE